MSILCRCTLAILALTAGLAAADDRAALDQLADACGRQQWATVATVTFTWTHVPSGRARTYVWNVPDNAVSATVSGATQQIQANITDDNGCFNCGHHFMSDDEIAAHEAYINDIHWLVFTLQAAWTDGLQVTKQAGGPVPGLAGITAANAVHLRYPAAGIGYTPGDAYTLHLGADGLPLAWEFFPGGAATAKLATTWEGWQTVGPLRVPTLFKTADGKPFITISDIAVTTR